MSLKYFQFSSKFIVLLALLLMSLSVMVKASEQDINTNEKGIMAENTLSLIPKPYRIHISDERFDLNTLKQIGIMSGSAAVRAIAEKVSQILSQHLKQVPAITHNGFENTSGILQLSLNQAHSDLGEEGYKFTITPESIVIEAASPAGLFYGVQTLRQLLLSQTQSNPEGGFSLPCLEITDKPSFQWRGLLLDCARHFMSKDFIIRYIDLLSYHKLNVLHLHLTDDQGWRIEIKKYPKLTKIGAWRGEGENRYGGYYTQQDLKEIIDYAESRYIRVVPEFEMPGHASAAIASYPELSCHGKPISVETDWGIFKDVFCPGKESTFEFLEGVLAEIINIFPSPYIHIGGDEAPRDHWEECPHCQKRMQEENLKDEHQLQSYLIQRIEKFLAKHDRRLIGWDEILEGGNLPPSAIVQSWRGMKGAIQASKQGHDVISSPNQYVYFDYPQTQEQADSKPNWMAVTTFEKTYSFHPVPEELTPEQASHVLGSECTMWTEHAPQPKVDQQLFPRLCAFCEIVWTPDQKRDLNDFNQRLNRHYSRLDTWNVDYYE